MTCHYASLNPGEFCHYVPLFTLRPFFSFTQHSFLRAKCCGKFNHDGLFASQMTSVVQHFKSLDICSTCTNIFATQYVIEISKFATLNFRWRKLDLLTELILYPHPQKCPKFRDFLVTKKWQLMQRPNIKSYPKSFITKLPPKEGHLTKPIG